MFEKVSIYAALSLSRRVCIWICVSHIFGVKMVVLSFSFNHWVVNVKRMVGRNKKQEGILILPQSVHTNWHLQLLAKNSFFFFSFLRTCVRENKFCFQGQLHGACLQINSQLCEHFYRSQESQIPGRFAFYVSALIFQKGLCIRLKLNPFMCGQ